MSARLDRALYRELVETRVRRPAALGRALRERRRDLVGPDGRLLIIASDHTARGRPIPRSRQPWSPWPPRSPPSGNAGCSRSSRRCRSDEDGSAVLDTTHERMVQAAAIASALGATSAHTWLKIPTSRRMAEIAGATSLPILMLGGDPGPAADEVFDTWALGLREPNVRRLIPGRMLLHPHDGDVDGVMRRAAALVHPSLTDITSGAAR